MSKYKRLKEKLKKNNLFLFIILFSPISVFSQKQIKFKKNNGLFLFYKLGEKKDSLIEEKPALNTFIYALPDSLKERYILTTCNGLFKTNGNDSTILFQYISGLQYQLVFDKLKNNESPFNYYYKLKSQINGTCVSELKKIRIEIFDIKTEKIILTNVYYLR
jgi:hypothetical protein